MDDIYRQLPSPIACDDCKQIVDRLYYDQYGTPVCADCWIEQEKTRRAEEDEEDVSSCVEPG